MWRTGVLLGVTLMLVTLAQDTRPQLRITRQNKVIRVIQAEVSSREGAEFIPRNPRCDDDNDLGIVFAPSPGFVETLINETRITSSIALLRRPKGTQEQEQLDLTGGVLSFNEVFCPDVTEETQAGDVTLQVGRTTIHGSQFIYDNVTGIGDLLGPVRLGREAEGNSPALEATSQTLSYDVDADRTLLIGGVRVESDGRVSEADELDYDETGSIAVLRGSPATSRRGGEFIQGNVIIYFLDSNDVVVEGNISGEIELELGESTPGSDVMPPETSSPDGDGTR